MKPTAEELKQEFLKMWMPKKRYHQISTMPEHLNYLLEAYAALAVAEATKDSYPKEFTRWLFWNEYYMTEEGLFSPVDNMPKGMLDELFNYWKNIKK